MIGDRAVEVVGRHPLVRGVRLVGSRATGAATAFSDWDFAVETDDFQGVARDMGCLIAPLHPLGQQWDPLSETWCWMAILRGPIKLDFIFAEPHECEPPWVPHAGNLDAIDTHFWDWALWLRSKQASGQADLLRTELGKMFVHVLHPMGVQSTPSSLDEAIANYLVALDRLESKFGVSVPRELRREVAGALDA